MSDTSLNLFGMICTDAFLGYRMELRNKQQGGEVGMISYKDFLHKLAFQLIFNGDNGGRQLRRRAEVEEADVDAMQNVRENYCKYYDINYFINVLLFTQDHRLLTLLETRFYRHIKDAVPGSENYNRRAKRNCSMPGCTVKTAYYCLTCSDMTRSAGLICICNPTHKTKSTCYHDHLASCNVIE
jgi:hypothetical protein